MYATLVVAIGPIETVSNVMEYRWMTVGRTEFIIASSLPSVDYSLLLFTVTSPIL